MSIDNPVDGPVALCTPFNPCPPCCPEISFSDNKFVITDDYDSRIELKLSEINQVINDLDKIIGMPGDSLDN